MTQAPPLFVTNFNPNFTGVSATAAGVVRAQAKVMDLRLVGHPLPGCPPPIDLRAARKLCRRPPEGKPFAIWHVRRNPEMRAAIWARDVLRLPIRIVFTSAAQRRHSALPRWLISRMDAVIATTAAAAGHVPDVRAVVPHGVDTARFTPPADKATAWAATGFPGDMGIATIGRIRPEKGTDLFVETMLGVLPDHSNVTALVIGRAETAHQGFLGDLRRRVEAAGLTNKILFPGEIEPDRLPGLIGALSLLVPLPRYEGYGMTPLEAMASGVPFVASDTGYFSTFAADGRAGQIVDIEDVQAATVAVRQLLDDPAMLNRMSLDASRIARENHAITREAEGINAVYDQLWAEGATA